MFSAPRELHCSAHELHNVLVLLVQMCRFSSGDGETRETVAAVHVPAWVSEVTHADRRGRHGASQAVIVAVNSFGILLRPRPPTHSSVAGTCDCDSLFVPLRPRCHSR
jgi:hypothetical protein